VYRSCIERRRNAEENSGRQLIDGVRRQGRLRIGMLEELTNEFSIKKEDGYMKHEGWFGRMKRCAESRSQWRAGCHGPA